MDLDGRRPDGTAATNRPVPFWNDRVPARALSTAAGLVLALLATAGSGHADEGQATRLQAIAAAEQAAEKRWRDAQRVRREHQRRSAAAHARMRMQGVNTMHASTPSPPNGAMCLAPGVAPARFSPVRTAPPHRRMRSSESPGQSISLRGAGASDGSGSQAIRTPVTNGLGLHRPSPTHPLFDAPGANAPMRERRVAFLPSASREPAWRGILRLASPDARPTIVRITAHDDRGRAFGPAAVSLVPGHTLELTSSDLEGGNPLKGLHRGIGAGQGDWRLVVQSTAKLDALAYAETAEGLRTPLRDIGQAPDGLRHVPLFPAAAAEAPGLLRLSNPGSEPVEARIRARDDAGGVSEVRATLPPGTSRWLSAGALESGQRVSGALGDGAGDWRLAIQAPAPIHAFAFSSPQGGELGDLAPLQRIRLAATDTEAKAAWLPSTPGGEGLLRIANRSPRPGTATLRREAQDRSPEPLTVRLEANAAVTLSASDLEFGNPPKGLPQGFGAMRGDIRLTVQSSLDLDVLAYVRGADSGIAAMQDAVPQADAANRRVLPMFPAGGGDAEGRLLLSNRSDTPATVRIEGVDDEGRASQPATLTLPANGTRTLTSAQLAWGAPELDGWLGAGRGHWRLGVWSNAALEVTGLLATAAGGLANISTASSPTASDRRVPQPIGDLNGDGKDDVLLRHVDGRWTYYPMDGRTPIESERGTVALERSARWRLAGIGDMDGDGRDDVLLRHTDGRWKGYIMEGRTVLESGGITGLPADPVWNVAGLGDLGADGKTDVVLRHPEGQWLHAPLDGLAVAPSAAVEPNLTKSTKWSFAGIGDLNGDGRDDILLRHDDGRWHYYPMNGSLAGSGRGSVTGVTHSLDWQLAGLGDLNGDGNDDILLRHVEGRWTQYPMNGRNVMDGRGGVPLTPNTAWSMAGLGDLNGDGNADALLRHDDGRWTYYPLDGRTVLAGRGTARITRNPDWSTTGPDPEPDEATKDDGPPDETAEDVFASSVSHVVQSQCATCHVSGGVSGNTRLVFVAGDGAAANLEVFRTFLATVDGGDELILNKVQGVDHGGGIQLASGTEGFASMQRFLGLLTDGPGAGPSVTPANLFAGVTMEPARSTLRRAAIVFAGRIPTDAEYESIKTGGIASLRRAIRGLMTGPGFHEFLIRAGNDRLLTDRHLRDHTIENDGFFVDFDNEFYRRYATDREEASRWEQRVQYGAGRAPLELIAHVVANDLPYTEVLTADYIMANAEAARAYGAATEFEDPGNVHEFRPSDILGYYRQGEGHVSEFTPGIGLRVIDPGPLRTRWPHAGILNAKVFLKRYPTTATNRNRARARWTYYHFLGLDIEKSASRTTDPVALADTNNPTMHNPACTVCHTIMDPVAGAFQNYGDVGFYRDQWGGLDALDDLYKSNLGAVRGVEGASRAAAQTLSWAFYLAEGRHDVAVNFTNDFYDEQTGEDGFLYLDRLDVIDASQGLVSSHEFEEVGPPMAPHGPCGEARSDHLALWNGGAPNCTVWIALDLPASATYSIEVVAWADRFSQYTSGHAEMSVGVDGYRHGDTWYRDMREPGFGDKRVPSADNSLQWLAKQIVADPRFAEATVKFWWPAVMGGDVVEPPSEGDPGFQSRLLASNAQTAEVERLAGAFRRGFGGGPRYNLKDLLTEVALSKWFRASSAADGDPVRTASLANAGAKRLLTPEELSRKTVALTGFDWKRHHEGTWNLGGSPNWTNAEKEYGLLYGGIDSDGITERGRDLTSVMAGVAQRHAAEVSCPVVMKDFYLLDEASRRLFGGVRLMDSPVAEFGATRDVEASSKGSAEEVSVAGHLTKGAATVTLAFTNDKSEGDRDRNLRLDRLVLHGPGGRIHDTIELEDLPRVDRCNHPVGDHFALHCEGALEVPINIPADGRYEVEVVAWADQFGDEPAKLAILVGTDTVRSRGAEVIRNKLVELHRKLLGVDATPSSPDIGAAYKLFVDIWNRTNGDDFRQYHCRFHADDHYFDGILDDVWFVDEEGERRWKGDRVDDFIWRETDMPDPYGIARTWVVVLAYLMTDPRYLHL